MKDFYQRSHQCWSTGRQVGLVLALIGAMMSVASGLALASHGKVDTSASYVQWTGKKLIGDKHTGKLRFKSGLVTYKDGKPVKAKLVIDMNSLTNEDLKDPKWNQKLVGHLKSDDFFDVKKHPTATLVAESIQPSTPGSYVIKGTLTIKNKSQKIDIPVKLEKDTAKSKRVTSKLSIDRTLWDVRYGSGKFFKNLGDKVIADDVDLMITLVLKK